jgi:hypothetical protein
MNDQKGFWQPIDLIVDLFTKEGRRNLRGIFMIFLRGAARMIAAAYIVTGRGLF